MSAPRRALSWARARPGTIAIVMLGIAWGATMHQMGWAQLGHFAEVKSLADGRRDIDPWHWETGDVAYIDGHYYSVKSPGMAAISTPVYLAIEAAGGLEAGREAALRARQAYQPRWMPDQDPPYGQYGYDRERALRVEERIENATPVVWSLTLFASVIPSVALLFGVRRIADRMVPGYGAAAAITLGAATILMIFAAEFFSHAISTALAFAAFAVLMRERAGPQRLGMVAGGGLLAGLAVTFEFQVGLAGVVLFGYALARAGWIRRAAAYAAGGLAGAIPALAFNLWLFGTPFQLAYGDAVATIGLSGHDVVGLNDDGFFGITLPDPQAALDLLVGGRGLLVLTPVLLMGLIGVVLMHRNGHRAEARTIGALAAAYFLYDCAYWQPYGGGTPGPRFLIPTLPFLALGFAYTYRRLPATTLALAIPSALWMIVASITYPLIGEQGTGLWLEWLVDGRLEHTVLAAAGVDSNWLAIAPVLACVAAAIALAVAATPRLAPVARADLIGAFWAVAAWTVVSVIGPTLAGEPLTPLDGSSEALAMIAVGALAALTALTVLRYRSLGDSSPPPPVTGELALSDPTP